MLYICYNSSTSSCTILEFLFYSPNQTHLGACSEIWCLFPLMNRYRYSQSFTIPCSSSLHFLLSLFIFSLMVQQGCCIYAMTELVNCIVAIIGTCHSE